jgi:DNA gyrase inhibitor GyrI
MTAAIVPSQGQPQPGKEERQDFSSVTDEQFARMAEQINLTEIAAGTHATTKGKRSEVQQFGFVSRRQKMTANVELE